VLLAAAIAAPSLAHPFTRGEDAVTPADAVATAARLRLEGPVFNGERFGGYLAFAGVPTFIDGRIEMYGDDFLGRQVAAERGDAVSLRQILESYGIAWTLLPPEAAAVRVLDRLPGWVRKYADERAVIHKRIGTSSN
jgi:hypothetical protein